MPPKLDRCVQRVKKGLMTRNKDGKLPRNPDTGKPYTSKEAENAAWGICRKSTGLDTDYEIYKAIANYLSKKSKRYV